MPQSFANFDAALKDDYQPGLRESLNNGSALWTLLARNEEDIQGRQAIWAMHTGRSTSTGGRAEYAQLPTPDRQRFTNMREDLAYLYHTIEVSGQAIHLTKGDAGSFARALETEIKRGENDVKNDMNRQAMGAGPVIAGSVRTGTLGQVTGVAGNVLTLGNMSESEMRYFFINERIDGHANATAAKLGNTMTITAINRTAKTITVDAAAAGIAANDWLAREGSFNQEINGLRLLISATTPFAGVDPATVPAWASMAVGSTVTPISEVLLDQAAEAVETDGNGDSPTLFLFSHIQRRKLASQLQAQRRYDGREKTLQAGWVGLDVARGSLIVDRYCPDNDGFAINTKDLVKFVGLDWTWDTDDKGTVLQKREQFDAVYARFKAYINLVTVVRNSHTRITVSTPTF